MAKEKIVKDESSSPSLPKNGATDGEEHGKSALLFPKLPDKGWVRPLEYRKSDLKGKPHELKASYMTRAAWGQATGVEVPKASWCRTCASGAGPFISCVIADDGKKLLSRGACMSCAYYGHMDKCSFVDENGSTPRFILNHAMQLGGNNSAATPKDATESSPSQKRKVASVPATPSKAHKSSKTTTPKSASKAAVVSKDMDNYDDIDDLAVLLSALGELEDDMAALKLRIKKLQLEKNVEEIPSDIAPSVSVIPFPLFIFPASLTITTHAIHSSTMSQDNQGNSYSCKGSGTNSQEWLVLLLQSNGSTYSNNGQGGTTYTAPSSKK
ncbi:hypothetical protein N7510_008221 [Penicillium lagena]|uniref:uncharacterized protein n=1 Tax=Penicillium lagena TaxID=94218 RepID=UPI0025407535|nr:uncharacterized protein N7510_008221 [Penicillium lagena]KAJ5605440.1 hypothetical protein N7510_008221 [Penicillium lagena]